jgi:WD40 repeat protein
MRSDEVVASLYGHEDFGFSLAWHPNGMMMATGNQDMTCKIWDLRYLRNDCIHGEAYCLKTLNCTVG